MDHKSNRFGFTLVELLVVIAIITILAGLLLPTLGRAIDAAKTTSCASGEHQIGLLYTMYNDDYDGYFPPANMQYMTSETFSLGLEKTIPHFLGPYIGYPHWYAEKYGSKAVIKEFRHSLFYCPAYTLPYSDLTLFRGGYGQSVRLAESLAYKTASWPALASTCARFPQIKRSSQTVVLADCWRDWHLGSAPPELTDLDDKTANIDMTRHIQGCNILFADSHVAWMEGSQLVNTIDKGFRFE